MRGKSRLCLAYQVLGNNWLGGTIAINPLDQPNQPDTRVAAVRKVLPLIQRLKDKYDLEFLSIGGGLGIVYQPALESGSGNWWKSAKAKNILTPSCASFHRRFSRPLGCR